MVIQKIYNKRPYWVDSLEDKPTLEGFNKWKTQYLSNQLTNNKAAFKFNQINFETYELCWNNATQINNFPNLYFELIVNNKTYYLFVEQISRIYNGGAVYICKVDNWATFCCELIKKLRYSGLKLNIVRGHFTDDEMFLPDEKLNEAYIKIPNRNNKLLFEVNNHGIIIPNNYNIVSNNLYAVFKQDNVENPYLIFPVILEVDGFVQNGIKYYNSGTFVQTLLDNPHLGYTNKFMGIFNGPVVNGLTYTDKTINIGGSSYKIKVANINNSDILRNNTNTHIRLVLPRPNITYLSTYTMHDEEFWKLNTADKAKSWQVLNMLEYQIGATKLNLPNMLIKRPGNNREYELWFSGISYFNGELATILTNPRLNRNERILKYCGSLPSASSGYAQQVQGVYNQTNTGLQIAKETYLRNQSYNLIGGVFSGVGKLLTGDIGGAFNSAFGNVKTGIEHAYAYTNKKRQIAAHFKDMQLNSLPNVNNSLDQTYLDMANEVETIFNSIIRGEDLNIVRMSRNYISAGNIIEMNNIVTKYGFYYWDYMNFAQLKLFNINLGGFSYAQIDANSINNVVQPYLVKNCDNTTPNNIIWEFCQMLIDGIRLWDKTDNEYMVSTTTFNNEVWNG